MARTGITPVVDADLREVYLGEWEGGLLRQKAVDRDPLFDEVLREQRWDVVPGAESRKVFGGRLPEGVKVTTKHQLGSPPAAEVAPDAPKRSHQFSRSGRPVSNSPAGRQRMAKAQDRF